MPTIYLIRHGEKVQSDYDPELTTHGHEQAKRTGTFLQQFPISKIIVSPRIRAQQTAGHIGQLLSVSIDTDSRLVERMDYGEGKHQDRTEFFSEWTIATHNRLYVPKAGTSSFDTGKRIESVINELSINKMHVAIVTHGGAIADFLRNIFSEDLLLPLRFDFTEGNDFNVKECSVTILTLENDLYKLIALHKIDHLLT